MATATTADDTERQRRRAHEEIAFPLAAAGNKTQNKETVDMIDETGTPSQGEVPFVSDQIR